MGTKPNQNWQQRSYEAFTPNVKLDINNPQEGASGPIVYNMLSSSKGGQQSSCGMTESGLFHLYNDLQLYAFLFLVLELIDHYQY